MGAAATLTVWALGAAALALWLYEAWCRRRTPVATAALALGIWLGVPATALAAASAVALPRGPTWIVLVAAVAAAAPWRRVLDEARTALRFYPLSVADREDVAQSVALTAYRRWHTYRATIAPLERWVRGIVRNEVRHLRRSPGRHETAQSLDELPELAAQGGTAEAVALHRVIAQRLLAHLPEEHRRAVMLVELEGRTLKEAAAVEGSSTTRMHARYHAGMEALRALGRAS